MKPYQQLIQNLVASKGWGEPESVDGSNYVWRFTHSDGRQKTIEAELQLAYSDLMRDEGYSLNDLEMDAWVKSAQSILVNAQELGSANVDLSIDFSDEVYEHGEQPGSWVALTGRIWVPIEKALAMTGANTDTTE